MFVRIFDSKDYSVLKKSEIVMLEIFTGENYIWRNSDEEKKHLNHYVVVASTRSRINKYKWFVIYITPSEQDALTFVYNFEADLEEQELLPLESLEKITTELRQIRRSIHELEV